MNQDKLYKLDFSISNMFVNNDEKKKINDFTSKAYKLAKKNKCEICNRNVDGFCNSHSIPDFCLGNIARNGEVYDFQKIVDNELLKGIKGVRQAGVFRNICIQCDNTMFKEYESAEKLSDNLDDVGIAQIALKNNLKYLYKHSGEYYMVKDCWERCPTDYCFRDSMHMKERDMQDFRRGVERAKDAIKSKESAYTVFYFKKLEYVVPIAFQGIVTLVVDFDRHIINKIWSHNTKYYLQYLHIGIFPLENQSIIIMFFDKKNDRYKRFVEVFNSKSEDEKLAIINYIIFLYTEDMFISPDIDKSIFSDRMLKDIAQKTPNPIDSITKDTKSILINEFNLDRFNDLPNLLNEKYKLK